MIASDWVIFQAVAAGITLVFVLVRTFWGARSKDISSLADQVKLQNGRILKLEEWRILAASPSIAAIMTGQAETTKMIAQIMMEQARVEAARLVRTRTSKAKPDRE